MIKRCYKCDATLSSYSDACPNCGAKQSDPKLVKKAGIVFKRNVATIRRIFTRPAPPHPQ